MFFEIKLRFGGVEMFESIEILKMEINAFWNGIFFIVDFYILDGILDETSQFE